MAVDVVNLAARLGLDVDEASFLRANLLMQRTQGGLLRDRVSAPENAPHLIAPKPATRP
jgi:hypothetical protein